MLFSIKNGKLLTIKSKDFNSEEELQNLCDNNLELIFGYKLIKSQFRIKNNILDALAFDSENDCFVIVEYKNIQNKGLVEQGFAYLSLITENKANVILEYNKKIKKSKMDEKDFDWRSTKIIFVSPSFTERQVNANNFRDTPFELWKITRFSNQTIEINRIEQTAKDASINGFIPQKDNKSVRKSESKGYSFEELSNKLTSEKMKGIYIDLSDYIMSLNNMTKEAKKLYMVYKKDGKTLFSLEPNHKQIYIFINDKYNKVKKIDKYKLGTNVSQKGHHAGGEFKITIKDDDKINQIKDFMKKYYYEVSK